MQSESKHKVFEEYLIMQCKANDQKAFTLLVNRWHFRLLRQAARVVKDPDTAKDVVQNSWIVIAKNIHSLKNPSHFGPWALRIVYNKSIDHIRKKKQDVVAWIPEDNDTERDKNIHVVMEKLRELPENHRMILSMFYLEEMPVAEIAYVLNIPPGTVKSRLYHAREYFRNYLKLLYHEK